MCRLCVYTLLCGSVVCVTCVYNGESVCVWICEYMYVGLSGRRPVTFA